MGDAKAVFESSEAAAIPDLHSAEARRRSEAVIVERQYPRRGGVVVPPELAVYCQDLEVTRFPTERGHAVRDAGVARALARAVVQRMSRAAYALPQHILELTLPSPTIVLKTFVLDERTRRVLERAQPFTPAVPWTVARYLDIPRFGPFCLVDLLAARAESLAKASSPRAVERPLEGKRVPSKSTNVGSRARASNVPLDELSALLVRSIPMSGERIAETLLREGMPQFSSARALERAYRNAGQPSPFRIIRHGSCEILVAPTVRNAAKAVMVTASQFVSWWGLTAVQEIATRAQLRTASLVTAAFAERVLATLPKIVWLDQGRQWFSFLESRSALLRAVRKALATNERLELPALRNSLTKAKELLEKLPAGAWERYLSVVAGCTIEGRWALGLTADGSVMDRSLCVA